MTEVWQIQRQSFGNLILFYFLCPIIELPFICHTHVICLVWFFSHGYENVSPFIGQFVQIGSICLHFPCKCLQSSRISFSQMIFVYPSVFSKDNFPPASSNQEYHINLLILVLYLQVCLSRNIGKSLVKLSRNTDKLWFISISSCPLNPAVADESTFIIVLFLLVFAPECPVLQEFSGLLWYALNLQIVANQSRIKQVVTTC